MSNPAPVVGNWFARPGGDSFEVVAIDRDDLTIEIQYFDGTIEELDFEDWGEEEIEPAEPPEELVDRWYDLWMREGQREAQLDRLSQYVAGDIEGLVRSIRVPVLLLWGEANQTAKFEQSVEFRELLKDAPSLTFISYPGVGHMAVEQAGAETGRDVRAWLDTPI